MNNKQLKAGVVLNYLAQVIHILTAMVYTPVLLRLVGQSEYGLYQLVYSVVSYLNILTSGFSSSYMRFFARHKKGGNNDEIASLNGLFLILFLGLIIIVLLCGCVMILNPALVFGSGLMTKELAKLKILVAVMIVNIVLSFLYGTFECYAVAHEQFIFQKGLIVISNIFNPLLTLPLLLLGWGSVGIVAITTLITFVKLVLCIIFCVKKLRMRFSFRGFDLSDVRTIGSFTVFVFISNVAAQINNNLDSILLGRFSGTISVAIYSIAAQLISIYKQLSSAISQVFIPRINRLSTETTSQKKLSDLFIKIGRIQAYIVGLLFLGMLFFGKQFIYLWAGKDYNQSYGILIILVVAEIAPCIQTAGTEIQRAYEKHKLQAIVFLLIAVVNVLISIPCIKIFGTNGAAIGTSVALIGGYWIFQNIYYKTQCGIDIKAFWKNIGKIAIGWIPAIIFGLAVQTTNLYRWLVLFLVIFAFTIIYCLSEFLLSFNTDEKRMVSNVLSSIAKKKG